MRRFPLARNPPFACCLRSVLAPKQKKKKGQLHRCMFHPLLPPSPPTDGVSLDRPSPSHLSLPIFPSLLSLRCVPKRRTKILRRHFQEQTGKEEGVQPLGMAHTTHLSSTDAGAGAPSSPMHTSGAERSGLDGCSERARWFSSVGRLEEEKKVRGLVGATAPLARSHAIHARSSTGGRRDRDGGGGVCDFSSFGVARPLA